MIGSYGLTLCLNYDSKISEMLQAICNELG